MSRRNKRPKRRRWIILVISAILLAIAGILWSTPVGAQDSALEQQENDLIQQFTLPEAPRQRPVYRPRPPQPRPSRSSAPSRSSSPSRPAPSRSSSSPSRPAPSPQPSSAPKPSAPETPDSSSESSADDETYQYVLNFSRSPVVGNRLRLAGVYPETRLGFTRPRHWDIQSVKAVVRYQHSPALLGDRSHLTLRINNTSVGSVPLDRPESQIAEAVFDIPTSLIQDYNDLSLVAVQHTSETCTNPSNPAIWTEVLPDSKLLFDFKTEAVTLDLSQFPYPFIDPLSLDPNRISYLAPETYTDDWATAAARFQVAAARMAKFQPLDTQMADDVDALTWGDHLLIIGTPKDQPLLGDLDLPFTLKDDQILDGDDTPLPNDAGLLILTTVQDGTVPALIVTGNAPAGVEKAIRLLSQPTDRQMLTGQTFLVSTVSNPVVSTDQDWPGYLPRQQTFQLSDLSLNDDQSMQDITVHGAIPPAVQVPFKAPPGEAYLRGSTMTLSYSYSRQVNPRTSAVEVKLDGVSIESRKLDNWRGGRKSFTLDLPPSLITPDSVLTVNFILDPRDSQLCGPETDDQLWGTLHSDTSFNLKHDTIFELPDLKLLTAGFPVAAPQDLSQLAIALPQSPNAVEIDTLLALTKRLGQITRADAVNLLVSTGNAAAAASDRHVMGIGLRDRFPIPQVLQDGGLQLRGGLTRFWQESQTQSLPNYDGILKAVVLDEGASIEETRMAVALTADTEAGLSVLEDLLNFDSLFTQIAGDTVLVNRISESPQPYDPGAYTLTVLDQETEHQRIQDVSSLRGMMLFLQRFWVLIPMGMVAMALLLYGISQLYVNRISRSQEAR